MPDNPNTEFHLHDHAVVALTGRDALAFAQAQFMNDINALQDGQWQWNGWLTAQGRLICLFAALRMDAQTLWLIVPDHDPSPLIEALKRYVFRSKVTITLHPAGCAGAFAAPQAASANRFATLADGGVELDLSAAGGTRRLRIGTTAMPADADALARWASFDLRHGLPRLSGEPRWTPQQLSLERLHAFSIKKGCYPGQEVVSRTHFLGQSKRMLGLFDVASPLAADATIERGDAKGTVISQADGVALAVIGTDAPADDWHCGEVTLTRRELLDGLAR